MSEGAKMSERDNVPQGAVSWLDLWTSDVEGSRSFYSELFGWEAWEPSAEFGGYWMFARAGQPVAGGMGDMGDTPADNTWKIYVACDDINVSVAAAEALGAQVFAPVAQVGDLGIQAVLADATGATMGLWQPLSFKGFSTTDEHGAPCWFELYARDYHAAVNFYTSVFGLAANVMMDTDEFRYSTLMVGEHEVAGVFDASSRLGEGERSHWVVYWQVDDVSAATQRVAQLGGSVIDGPADSPYGSIATVADPSGAVFKLRQAPSN